MKRTCLLFVLIIASVLLPGTSLARQGDHPSPGVPSQSNEKSNAQQKDNLANAKASPNVADVKEHPADVTQTPARHPSSVRHSKPVPINRAHPAKTPTKKSARTDATGSVASPEPVRSNAQRYIPNTAVSVHRPATPSPAVSVNGQQFRNSRRPGARLVANGAPATTARGTAAINGTDMKPKH